MIEPGLRCASCEYALDGLLSSGHCPECNLAVQETLRRRSPTIVVRHLKEMSRGLLCAILANVAILALPVVFLFGLGQDIFVALLIGVTAFRLVGLIGWLVVFTRPPWAGPATRRATSLARTLRILEFSIWLVVGLLVLLVDAERSSVTAAALATFWMFVELACVLACDLHFSELDRHLGRPPGLVRLYWRMVLAAAFVLLLVTSVSPSPPFAKIALGFVLAVWLGHCGDLVRRWLMLFSRSRYGSWTS